MFNEHGFFFLKKLKEFSDILKKKKIGHRNQDVGTFFLGSNTAPLVVNVLLEDGFSGS